MLISVAKPVCEGLRVADRVGNTLSTNLVLGCGGAGFPDEGTGTVPSRNRID